MDLIDKNSISPPATKRRRTNQKLTKENSKKLDYGYNFGDTLLNSQLSVNNFMNNLVNNAAIFAKQNSEQFNLNYSTQNEQNNQSVIKCLSEQNQENAIDFSLKNLDFKSYSSAFIATSTSPNSSPLQQQFFLPRSKSPDYQNMVKKNFFIYFFSFCPV